MEANYNQVVPMTYEQKVSSYMKLSKIDLIKMLIECNRIIESIPSTIHKIN